MEDETDTYKSPPVGVDMSSRVSKGSIAGLQSSSLGSKMNLAGSRTNLAGSKMNLAGSRMNLAGSRGNLLGSKGNLMGLRYGSLRSLAAKASNAAAPEQQSTGPANAVVFENTYMLKPDKRFQTNGVRLIIEEILAKHLTKVKYDSEEAPELVKAISNDIMRAVKKLEMDRYKIVVDVNIGEFKGQGIKVASRAVWDTTTDSYTSASFRNSTIFAVAIVFGCYFE
ncbi:hypothetical protein BASA50_000181 [Batrachochytrium salamandrivorans]|uniref:Uncharacterized protein n=1 Tax=Batrachochytrium salamandrivorans TaxID=1357716 RepID=A0ABQ8EXC2_9FUNG|nr:hypothetical protein BASA62_003382 [Batrachochytrium salamandrivorans]KAH6580360.1 hypothetical protein BASA60_002893 [Batrachochytrium salamandrivorans]KAH6586817.1 hypothetical protein BASA50_000181 [Batrachochytrium salamandrivorans]KAH6595640.1 hypothetical protein BASA61_003739 [Batrachochytrium salamandrivorans]KAH9266899.1 hypothetical protein BASA83_010252 [Batrachochytrium salamandrivorans]